VSGAYKQGRAAKTMPEKKSNKMKYIEPEERQFWMGEYESAWSLLRLPKSKKGARAIYSLRHCR
jgi:hypothetical protein